MTQKNAFQIPVRSVMHGERVAKKVTPTKSQSIVIAPRISDTEKMVRDVFFRSFSPYQR